MLKNLKLLLKLTEKQGKRDECVTRAEGQLPDERTLLSFPWKSVLQRSGLRHLGMRMLVPFVLGSLVNCYPGVTEFNRFLENMGIRVSRHAHRTAELKHK